MRRLKEQEVELVGAWNQAADALEYDPMRPVRYRKCFRYFSDLDRGSKVVEIGCGEGSGLMLLQSLGFRRLVGIEVSLERLRRARRKLGKEIPLFLGSPTGNFPLKDNSVDAVVSAAVIEHTVRPRDFVCEIARILRSGGYAVISSDCYAWRVLQLMGIYRSSQPIDKALFPTTLFRYFRESGLQLLSYEGFPLPDHEFRIFRLLAGALFSQPRGIMRRLFSPEARLGLRKLVLPGDAFSLTDTNQSPVHRSLTWEDWPRRVGIKTFLGLIFSDENVFFLMKRS